MDPYERLDRIEQPVEEWLKDILKFQIETHAMVASLSGPVSGIISGVSTLNPDEVLDKLNADRDKNFEAVISDFLNRKGV